MAVGLLITAYALTVGLRADSDDPNGRKWIMLETLFATCFTLEMTVRVYAEGWRSYSRNNWSKLDIALVAVQWVDVVLSSATSLKILAVFGALRVLRLMQVITIGPGYRELWIIVNGMVESARATVWVALLLLVLLYVFGVVFTLLLPTHGIEYRNEWGWNGHTYWGSVWRTCFTLLQVSLL